MFEASRAPVLRITVPAGPAITSLVRNLHVARVEVVLPSPTHPLKTARSVILDAAAKLRMLRPELAAFVICSALAVVMGVRNADSLNHDAVSYVTLAQHYLDGRFDLVVVGTWSPLFVWLLVPLIAATGDHGLSLHLLSGFSALVFLAGGLVALRAFAPRSGVAPGAIVLAVVRSGLDGGAADS